MFEPLKDRNSRLRAGTLGASIVLHGFFLAWLLYAPGASVLAPHSVAAGDYGKSLTHLYFPTHSLSNDSDSGKDDSATQASSRRKLVWKKAHENAKPVPVTPPVAAPEAAVEAAAAKAAPAGPAAGTPYGSLDSGDATGDEIRPALPVSSTDPVVDPNDLAGHPEGNVVVEITIDDRGNIVQKMVLQSLGPVVDGKVLAAFESWHFMPATRNGIAIASKQDVHYHFKPS
jgi:TonB family protein